MAARRNTENMALYCDFENIALGVRDAEFQKFDIRKVIERLLLKGDVVVKKAYCDWTVTRTSSLDARSRVRADRDPARAAVGRFG